MTRPRVSVVIPNFNYGCYLGDALQSVISQTFVEWEAIVVDNFSSDESQLVAQEFNDPRIKFVQFANDGSIARARNFGVKMAQGQFIAFLDSDDKWDSRKLERQLKIMDSGADLSYHSLKRFGEKGGVFRAWSLSKKKPLEHLLGAGNPIATSSAIVRIDVINALGGFPEERELLAAEDYALWLKVAAGGYNIARCSGTLGHYRVHKSTTSRVNAPRAAELAATPFLRFSGPKVRKMHSGFVAYARGVRFESQGSYREARQNYLVALESASLRFAWRAAVRLLRLLALKL